MCPLLGDALYASFDSVEHKAVQSRQTINTAMAKRSKEAGDVGETVMVINDDNKTCAELPEEIRQGN
jgi:hypothetical protein